MRTFLEWLLGKSKSLIVVEQQYQEADKECTMTSLSRLKATREEILQAKQQREALS